MAIDLLGRLAQSQTNNRVSKKTTETVKNADSAVAAKILNTVLSLKAGDSLQGELVSVNGKELSLLLGNTILLSAKMEKELSLQPGQKMSFIVNGNQNGKLSLKPLFANTGMEQNAMKALDAAGIPVTDKTLALVEEMMQQGMPVNKQSLLAAYRQLGMYSEASVSDLVMLQKLDIPVTEENLSMMRLYQTNQHALFSDLQSFSAKAAEFLRELIQTQPEDTVQSFIREFLDIFQGSADGSTEGAPSTVTQAEILITGSDAIAMAEDGAEETVGGQEKLTEKLLQNKEERTIVAENKETIDLFKSEKTDILLKETEIMRLLKGEHTKTESGKETLTQNLFSLLKEQFLMKPEHVQSGEYVKEFYERLNEQVNKLQELIRSAGKETSSLGRETATVKSNIQFMNQINQMYHYVQLPLKMNENSAQGDLYVYKRKHAKTGEDGKLTALLHLSMPTLGNMDVFLALEEQKLSTRFCMEKEELIDFIEANIGQLNERLIKRGYQVQTTVTAGAKEEERTVIDEIMQTENAIPIMTSQSFDARC